MEKFQKELEELINKHSVENVVGMPDFLMAEMLVGLIKSIGKASKKNRDWGCCAKECE